MFKEIKSDLPASIIVFFVALPLCLGIALASGAPLFAGVIAGIVGGIIVGAVSGSPLGVSGPAAGLAVIVLTAIDTLGSWEAFLLATVIGGVLQLAMGFARAGVIAYFFPASVIKGMLSGIGLLIFLKQIPHALGYDKDVEGDFSFFQMDGETTLSAIGKSLESLSSGAIIITVLSLAILILWETVLTKKHKIFRLLQGPIVVILLGITLNYLYQTVFTGMQLNADQLVSIPVPENFSSFLSQFTSPDFSAIGNWMVWKTAFVIAIVASLETLLCVEATDKLDPYKRITPVNRELKAQGIGNLISGLIGGLPVTQVIVRSSANIAFGGKTKLSSVLHGFWLLISAVTIAGILNMIPLASLAAILLLVGYKLAKPSLFKEMYNLGMQQFVPFVATILGIIFTDLLTGITIGLVVGIFFTLYNSYKNSHYLESEVTKVKGVETHKIVLGEVVSFFSKANLLRTLKEIPQDSTVIVDYSRVKTMDYDVQEILEDQAKNPKTINMILDKSNFNSQKKTDA